MYEITNATYTPDNFIAGDFPIKTDTGAAKSGATIRKYAPVVQGENGIEEAAAATLADLVGIAADAPNGGEVVYYITGEFFTSAIALPADVTADALKPACRKLGIILREGN